MKAVAWRTAGHLATNLIRAVAIEGTILARGVRAVNNVRALAIEMVALLVFVLNGVFGQGLATFATSARADHDPLRAVLGEGNPRPRISRDDSRSPSFPHEFDPPKVVVRSDGYATLQEVGSVCVQGLTLGEAVAEVKMAIRAPSTAEVFNLDQIGFQKPYFLVLKQRADPAVQFVVGHDSHRSGWRCEGDAG
jgi:protein involved in polysaccharide export with SLBB domain